MFDPLAITDEEAEGLTRLAQAQLRLATRLSERALDEPDVDAACHLARASERVARGYRQSLLLKSRLKRDGDADRRHAALNPLPGAIQQQASVNRRIRDVHAAVERIMAECAETLDCDEAGEIRLILADVLEEESRNPRFLADPVEAQVARMCEIFDLPSPDSAPAGTATAAEPAPADSS
jgi:hypothetical protein